MLNLKQGENIVAVTLKEKGGDSSPFIVKLINKSTKEIVSFTAVDDSPYPERYNRLTFSIDLEPGQYEYVIESNTSPALVLETGLANVKSETPVVNTFSTSQSISTWKG